MPQDTPLSAGLAKRLAEAADGFRDNLYHFFLAKRTYPYSVVCPPGDPNETVAKKNADDLKKDLKFKDHETFGPFLTEKSDEVDIGYDSVGVSLIRSENGADLVIHTETLPATDAIVLNISAFDKFFLPYYTRLYGAEVARQFRTEAVNVLTNKRLIYHQRCTIMPRIEDNMQMYNSPG